MTLIILIVAMTLVGVLMAVLAGMIWKDHRPLGTSGDYAVAVLSSIVIGLMDWYLIPVLGFSDTLRNIGVALEPALGSLLVLWVLRLAKK